ncbi:MAG TPA: AAA family ATPase, partial [Candidatus Nanopelagicales bacterium]|nr:AAA family ATPase [Candidatus Nanopelagicales bacterium]
MITRVFARNYRSIGEVELELGTLTALVGPNGSGKSNLADVLRFLGDCMRGPLSWAVAERQGFGALRNRRAGEAAKITVGAEVRTEEGQGSWTFTLAPSRAGDDGFYVESESATWQTAVIQGAKHRSPGSGPVLLLPVVGEPSLTPLINELRSLAVYTLFPNTLRAPQQSDPSRPMHGSGGNWSSTLRALDRASWGTELLAGLARIVGDIDDYRVAQAGGFIIPEFRHGLDAQGQERWLGAAQESDGTLRVAAILTALFQEPSPSLMGF